VCAAAAAVSVFRMLLGATCRLLEQIKSSMMGAFDTAIQVTEKIDSQFVANIQYQVSSFRILPLVNVSEIVVIQQTFVSVE